MVQHASSGILPRLAGLLAGVALTMLAAAAEPAPPAILYGELYARVENEALFPDSKTFADASAREAPAALMRAYRAQRPATRAALQAFVDAHFDLPVTAPVAAQAPAPLPLPLSEHIVALWPQLTRAPLAADAHSSQLPLAHPYVVPGGRFREMYYWDSYFTMLGLVRDGHQDTTASMVDDFAGLLARYGHIPNGTRSYYLSRSQPPVFYLMVALLSADSADAWARYLPSLRAEYAYWMAGERGLRPGKATRNVVALPGGAILNRYWDALATPRDESYREDVALAAQAAHDGRAPASLYRDLRAAAESGWDFSSRWLRDPGSLASIETTAIVPVDLNSLLYGLERAISQGCARRGDGACAREFERRATARRAAITRYLWDARGARYLDYQWQRGEQIARPSAAMLYPLFTGVADAQQGQGVADAVRRDLLAPGGVLATPLRTGQQWDAPNGWAPLQWIAVQGLRDYGERELAQEIATRWLRTVARGYDESGRLLEKYDVLESRPGGGGEYPLQDGFGWTNGVTRALLDEAPLR